MAYSFDHKTPIYLQLKQLFQRAIVSGTLTPGSRMATVREIAVDYGVNPNTVQRALTELERDGLVNTQRTSGRFITEDRALIEAARIEMARSVVSTFTSEMTQLGYDFELAQELLSEHWRN